MSVRKKIIASCGYRCDLCPAYENNIHGKKDQQDTSDAWLKYAGISVKPGLIRCSGCYPGGQPLDRECPVRPCAARKGLANCGYCQDFPCDKLKTRMDFFAERLGDLSTIREDDFKRFIRPYLSKNLLIKINTRFRNPRTREKLLNDIESEYRLLKDIIRGLSMQQILEPGVCSCWSVKDLVAHLAEWKMMLLGWYRAGIEGRPVKTPAEDLKWSQMPELNERIHQKWKEVPWESVLSEFETTYRRMIEMTGSIPEEQLFIKQLYPWMQKSSVPLYRWIEANTSSHYRWARLLIRKWKNSINRAA